MSTAHRLTDAAAITKFMFAGDARFTLVSTASGERVTFRVQFPRNREDGKVDRTAPLFVKVLTGADNETSYSYLGFIRSGEYRHGGLKAKIGPDAKSAKAFEWFFRVLATERVPATVEFWHEGRCARCGRTLTVPASIASGFGPECIAL
jgi:hypothetical protein